MSARRGERRLLAEVEEGLAAVGELQRHEAAAAEVARRRIDDGERVADRDRGIDGVAAAPSARRRRPRSPGAARSRPCRSRPRPAPPTRRARLQRERRRQGDGDDGRAARASAGRARSRSHRYRSSLSALAAEGGAGHCSAAARRGSMRDRSCTSCYEIAAFGAFVHRQRRGGVAKIFFRRRARPSRACARRTDPSRHAPRPPPRRSRSPPSALGAVSLAGCTAARPGPDGRPASRTDTSMTWDIVKHVHGTAHRRRSDAVRAAQQRAARAQRPLRVRPGQHPHRRHRQARAAGLPARRRDPDPRLWRALPELIDKGAKFERCARRRCRTWPRPTPAPTSPAASPEVLKAIVYPRRERSARGPPRRLPHARLLARARRRPRPGARHLARSRRAEPGKTLVQPARGARPRPARVALRPRARASPATRRARRSTTTTAACRTATRRRCAGAMGRRSMVALRAAAARQPGAAEPRRPDGLGAAAARAADRTTCRIPSSQATWSAS